MCSQEKVFWKYAANLQETTMPKCDFNKVALQLYWNGTSAWLLFCKFAAYFHNTFSWEHLWVAAFGTSSLNFRSSCSQVFSSVLLCNFIEIALRHGCSPVNLLHIFRTPFLKNTSGRLHLVNWGSLEYPWRMDINWILIFDLTLDDKFGVIFIFD